MARLWASGATIVTLAFGGCVVSFEDYPVAESDGGAATGGSGGSAGAGATGGAGSGGSAGAPDAGGTAGVCAAEGDVRWVERYGSAPNDAFKGLAWSDSGLLVVGSHDATSALADFPLANAGNHDVFIGKLEPLGAPLWAKPFGTPSVEFARDAAVDPAGDLLVTGGYSAPNLDLGGGALPVIDDDEVFVAKFAGTTGATAWARGVAGGLRQTSIAVASYANGDVLVGLETDASITLDASTTNAQLHDIVLLKLGRDDGKRILGQPFGDANEQRLAAVGTGSDDTAYFAGSYAGEPPNYALPAANGIDGFVATLDPSFTPGPAVRFGGAGTQAVHALSVGASHVWLGGEFATEVDVDGGPTLTATHPVEGFFARMPLGGGVPSLYGIGAHSVVRDVVALPDGGAVIAGEYRGAFAFGGASSLAAATAWRWFVARVDASGTPSWTLAIGNDLDNQFPLLATGNGPSIVVGGAFQGEASIGGKAITTSGFDPLAVALCP